MKEKLKKLFTNKDFWTALLGCIGLLLSIVLSYFTGLKDGILLDNSIRTELIEKTLEETKNNKIDVSRKTLVNNESLTNVINLEKQVLAYIYTSSSSRLIVQDLELNLGYELGNYSTTFNLYFNFKYYISDISGSSSSSPNRPTLNNIGVYSFVFESDLQLASISVLEIVPIINFNATLETISFDYQVNIFNEFFVEYNYEFRGVSYDISSFINTPNTKLVYTENVVSISSLNDYIDNYWLGYEDRQNSTQDTENKINKIWEILEKAITSVLNVLSFEILPGMPLYICIGIPILLAVLLWFIKMGQS